MEEERQRLIELFASHTQTPPAQILAVVDLLGDLNPGQRDAAVRALREALAGDFMTMTERWDLNPATIRRLVQGLPPLLVAGWALAERYGSSGTTPPPLRRWRRWMRRPRKADRQRGGRGRRR